MERVQTPPRPDLPDRTLSGTAALILAVLSLMSPSVTGNLFEQAPPWIFVVGLVLGATGIAFAVRSLWAPKKTPGRGMAGIALAVALVEILFCLFGAAIQSTSTATRCECGDEAAHPSG